MNPGELKRLFAIVFENDRIALQLLRDARALLSEQGNRMNNEEPDF